MTLTKADFKAGAMTPGTAAYDKHFPKLALPEQRAPTRKPGPVRIVSPTPLVQNSIPPPPPPFIPKAPQSKAIPSCSSSSEVVAAEKPPPELEVEKVIQSLATEKKATQDNLNELAICAARAIRLRPKIEWASLLARCMQQLSHCARMSSEGQPVDWSSQRLGACGVLTKTVQTAIDNNPVDNDEGRRELARIFAFVICEQIFNEGNNRGAYFLVVMMGEMFKVKLPSQDRFKNRDKDASGFFKNKVQNAFLDMYGK